MRFQGWTDEVTGRVAGWLPGDLPVFVVAVGIVVVGYLAARLVRRAVVAMLRHWSARLVALFERVSRSRGIEPRLDREQAEVAAVQVLGRLTFWLVFALALAAATSVLGVSVLTTSFGALAGYLPRVLAAVAIFLLGVLAGHLTRVMVVSAAGSAGMPQARALAGAAQWAVIVLAGLVAVEELGIEVTFLVVLTAIVLGALLGGAALAFGLGARSAVEGILAGHYLARSYQVGQRVRVAGCEGRIAEILPTAVVLQTREGRMRVPTLTFEREISLLLPDEEHP